MIHTAFNYPLLPAEKHAASRHLQPLTIPFTVWIALSHENTEEAQDAEVRPELSTMTMFACSASFYKPSAPLLNMHTLTKPNREKKVSQLQDKLHEPKAANFHHLNKSLS